MADERHLSILKQGVAAWNKWRLETQGRWVGPRKSVHIYGEPGHRGTTWVARNCVDLSRTNLVGLDLNGINLSAVDLTGANLQGSELCGADMTEANLYATRFTNARLSAATFANGLVGLTEFVRVDLSEALGLDTVRHASPSTVDIETIFRSKGKIPEAFLRGCGVPEDFIVYMRSLVGKAIDYCSCFISYSNKDEDFAQRLYADLQAKNVRCWKFDENAQWGEPVWGEIDAAIRHYDKLVVICSEHSLQSEPVVREIERALRKEDHEHKNVLFPVRIDDHLLDKWEHPRKTDVLSKVIGDFRGWRDPAAYSKAFTRFLEALNRPPQLPKNRLVSPAADSRT